MGAMPAPAAPLAPGAITAVMAAVPPPALALVPGAITAVMAAAPLTQEVAPPPPPPTAVLEVPRLPPVPEDLVKEVAAETQAMARMSPAALQLSPVPAMPPMVMPVEDAPVFIPARRRSARVAFIVLPVAAAVAGLVWWFAQRSPESVQAGAPSANQASLPPALIETTEPPPASAWAAIPPVPSAATAVAATEGLPSAPPIASANGTPSTPPVATAAPVVPQVPVAPVAPARPRPKYEPQGI
jgi:hypothetical protein